MELAQIIQIVIKKNHIRGCKLFPDNYILITFRLEYIGTLFSKPEYFLPNYICQLWCSNA